MPQAICAAFLVLLVGTFAAYIISGRVLGGSPIASFGGLLLYPNDVLLAIAVLLLAAAANGSLASGRGLTGLAMYAIFAYLAYQAIVVLPVAVALQGGGLFPVLRVQMPRYLLVYIPCLYLVTLRGISAKRAIIIWSAGATAISFYAVASYFTGGAVGSTVEDTFRLRQTFGGASLLEAWLVFFALLFWRPSRVTVPLGFLGATALLLTNHRSAFLALGIACLFHLLVNRRYASRALAVVAVALTLIVTVSLLSPLIWTSTRYSFSTMFNARADANTASRADAIGPSIDYFLSHPYGDTAWATGEFDYGIAEPHDFVLQVLTQEGLVGAAFWIFLIFVTFRIAWRNRQTDKLTATLLTYFVFFLVFAAFNTTIRGLNEISALAVCVALIYRQDDLLRPLRRAIPPFNRAPLHDAGVGVPRPSTH